MLKNPSPLEAQPPCQPGARELDGVVGAELVAAVTPDARVVIDLLVRRRIRMDGRGGHGAAACAHVALDAA